ncbi:MAG: hypothetical protein ACI88C_002888 [Acidimicrobiales bacterium]|jgi:hypothetical protein
MLVVDSLEREGPSAKRNPLQNGVFVVRNRWLNGDNTQRHHGPTDK